MSAGDMRIFGNEARPRYRFRLRSLSPRLTSRSSRPPSWPEADKKP
jgi:hypothetical protein